MLLSPMTPASACSMPPLGGLTHYYDARHGLTVPVWYDLVGQDHLLRINDTGNLVIHGNNLQGLGSEAQGTMYTKENCDLPGDREDLTLFAVLEISSYANYTQPFFIGKGYTGSDSRGCRGFTTNDGALIACDQNLSLNGTVANSATNPAAAFVVAVLTIKDGKLNGYQYPTGEPTPDLVLRALEPSKTISAGGRIWAPDNPWHTIKWGNRIYACGVLDRAIDGGEIRALYTWAEDTFDNQSIVREGLIGLWDKQLSATPNGETPPFSVCNIARAKPSAHASEYVSTIPQDEKAYWKTGPDRGTIPRIPVSLVKPLAHTYVEFACEDTNTGNGNFGLYSQLVTGGDCLCVQTVNYGRDLQLYHGANTVATETLEGILTRGFHTWGFHQAADYLEVFVDGHQAAHYPTVCRLSDTTFLSCCVAAARSNLPGKLYTYRLYDRLPDEGQRLRNAYVDRTRFCPSA